MPRRPLLLLALLAACKRDAATTSPTPAGCPEHAVVVAESRPGTAETAGALAEPQLQRRQRGLAALDAGRYDLARAEFAAVLEVVPGNLGVQALFDAATRALLAAQDSAAQRFAARTPTPLPAPPWQYTLVREAPAPAGKPPKLVQLSARPHGAADEVDWMRDNDLRLPEYEVPNPMRGLPGDLPPGVPPTFGNNLLVQAIAHPDHTILTYAADYSGGRYLAVQGTRGETLAFLDFAAWQLAPDPVRADAGLVEQRVQWAEVRDGVLYVSHGHQTYARSSRGMNAYLSAIELATGALLWRSEPLVAGAFNFAIDGAHIYSGYGFTGEPDHLVVLERRTGKVVSRTRITSAPEYLFVRGRRLLLRTHDTAHEFELR